MARRVFFSFHYDEDVWRANQVRNCWVTHPDRQSAGFFDASLWESSKRNGDEGIKRMIRDGLQGTSVTAILVGANTAGRTYIDYEIDQSHNVRHNGILAIRIDGLGDRFGYKSTRGRNPLDEWTFTESGKKFSDIYSTYDWVLDNGHKNCAEWFHRAAQQAGK
jgi:hypothetical protein